MADDIERLKRLGRAVYDLFDRAEIASNWEQGDPRVELFTALRDACDWRPPTEPVKQAMVGSDRLWKMSEAAERLHVSRQTLYHWKRIGRIRAIRLPSGHYRIAQTEIDRYREPELVGEHTHDD